MVGRETRPYCTRQLYRRTLVVHREVKREFDVAKASRKERKRIDRRDRRKRQAQEQQRAVVFVTVFRKLALAGWLGDEFVEIARVAGGRDNLLSIVESTCAAHSQQPGDDDSWSSLVWTARDHGAPESVLDSLATKWSLAHPESKEARRFRLWYRGRPGPRPPRPPLARFAPRRGTHEVA